jgi:hypothetical protein
MGVVAVAHGTRFEDGPTAFENGPTTFEDGPIASLLHPC